jgi:MFS family permease
MRELFKLRNYRVYLLGSTVDTIGDMAFWLAAAIWVKELTGSTGEAGLVILFLTLGTLLSPVTGVLVDRLPRKRTLMVTNALTALIVLSLVTVHRANQVWLIFVVMFLYGVSSTITTSAFNGLKEQLMPKELFGHASGLGQAAQQGTRLITPAIGLGLLAAFGGRALAMMDACTFVVGLACWSLIRIEDPRPQRPTAAGGLWRESTAGFRYLFGTPVLRQLTLALAVAVFGMGFFETLCIAIATVGLHHAPTWTGVLVTTMGASGLAGGLAAGAVMRRIGPGFLVALGLGICVPSSLAMAVPDVTVVLAAAVLLGLALPFVIVGSMTALQLFTPNELMGRVSGVDNLIVTGMQTVGIGAGAALIGAVDYRLLCSIVAALMGASALYIFTRKAQRKANLPVTYERSETYETSGSPIDAGVAADDAARPVTTPAANLAAGVEPQLS